MPLEALARTVDRYTRETGSPETRLTDVPGLHFLRRIEPTAFESFVYDPIVCLILQGRKETTIGERWFSAGAGSCIVVSHDLPVMARITDATASTPYLAAVARLELSELRGLYDEIGPAPMADAPTAYAVGPADDTLLDVMNRYVALAEEPGGVRVLTPLIRRELHFRLLTSDQGAMLRTLLHRDSHASSISRALKRLRAEFRETLEVAEIAQFVGMSTSSFHRHFKQVTATTPLQFQKDLRLTEARRLLLAGGHSVSTVAYEVGYESTTQFSREYSRKFGGPPSHALRNHAPSAQADRR